MPELAPGPTDEQVIRSMDHNSLTAGVFHKLADKYREKYMDLTLYHDSYREFCDLLPETGAAVLDAACGPGNVSRYLLTLNPRLELLGIDFAPRMIELAREAVPSARFLVYDCRRLTELHQRFRGIICAFGLPYFSAKEAGEFIQATGQALEPEGVLYLSTMLGRSQDSGWQRCSSGDEVYVHYHSEDQVLAWVQQNGFQVVRQQQLPSPGAAAKATTDLILIAKKMGK